MVRDPRLREERPPVSSRVAETQSPRSGCRPVDFGLPRVLWEHLLEASDTPLCLEDRNGRYCRTNTAFDRLVLSLGRSAACTEQEAFPELSVAGLPFEHADSPQPPEVRAAVLSLRGKGVKVRVRATRMALGTDAFLLAVEVLSRNGQSVAESASSTAARVLLDAMPEMAWLKDEQGLYQFANLTFAQCASRSITEIVGRTDADVWPPRVAARMVQQESVVRISGEEASYEELFADRAGMRWIKFSMKPLLDGSGVCVGIAGRGRDVSEHKLVEERQRGLESRLEQTQRLESVGLLAGGLAHDINNLLVGVLGHAELALREFNSLTEPSSMRERLCGLRAAALQASALTTQMLAYCGRAKSVIRPVNLSEVVQQARSLIANNFAGTVCFDVFADEGIAAVDADAAELQQVVLNLLTNAAEAIAVEGLVTVRISQLSAERIRLLRDPSIDVSTVVLLEVEDTGVGMTPEVAARVFEPFFSTKPSGRGLGMAAVRAVVSRLGGDIRVRSCPGEGTTVSVELPCSRSAAISVLPKDEPKQNWETAGDVLVVDDQQAVRTVASLILKEHGFIVHQAATAKEALETFRRHMHRIRAVLLDLSLPDSSGQGVLSELRLENPQLPIIVWSGYDEQDVRHAFGSDVDFVFVQKPFSMDALVRHLRALLGE